MSDEIEKKYYSISEVASKLSVTASLIRFWESQFPKIKPQKNKNGIRQYTKQDLEKLQTIHFLVKEKGYTLQGANDVISQKTSKIDNVVQVIKELSEIKDFLIILKKTLAVSEQTKTKP